MAPRPLRKVSGTGRRPRAPYRRWTLALAALTATLLVGTFLQPAGSTPPAAAAPNDIYVYGWPGQSGLKVWRHICDDGRVPRPDWDFQTITGAPPPFGPEAVGWQPKPGGGAYGIEAYFPSAPDVDIFQIEAYAPGGQTSGWARVDYSPRPGNVDYIGVIADFVDTQPGWHTIDASDWQYDWYPKIGGDDAGPVIENQTIEQITNTFGAGSALFTMYLGCDGRRFYVDGYQVGSSVTGWNSYDLEAYLRSDISLRLLGGRISTCGTSPKRFPQSVSFRGGFSPAGRWEGQQYVGRRNGRWRVVARGNSGGSFGYQAKVRENSWFDAVYPGTLNYEFSHSEPDWYVPAFPSIKIRAADLVVRKGQRMVFTGSIKPAKKLHYTILRAVPKGKKWSRFQSLGTFKTNNRGRFRFTVRTPTPGWARINILTQTEKDLTSALTPRAIVYQVLKPRKPPKRHSSPGPTPQPTGPDPTPDYNAPDPGSSDPPTSYGRPKGFGNCRWVPVGGPPGRPIASRTVDDAVVGGDRTEAMVTPPVSTSPEAGFGRYAVTEAPAVTPAVPLVPNANLPTKAG
jgi:hypothetical protein